MVFTKYESLLTFLIIVGRMILRILFYNYIKIVYLFIIFQVSTIGRAEKQVIIVKLLKSSFIYIYKIYRLICIFFMIIEIKIYKNIFNTKKII